MHNAPSPAAICDTPPAASPVATASPAGTSAAPAKKRARSISADFLAK